MLRILIVLILLSTPCLAEDKKPTDADKAQIAAAEQATKDKKERQAKGFEKALAELKVKHNCEQVVTPAEIVGFIIRGQNGAEQLLKIQIVTIPRD